MIKSCSRPNPAFSKILRLRRCVGIERRIFDVSTARPESTADYFVRIGLASDQVRSLPRRSAASREAGNRQIEASPEEMHGAAFSDEVTTKLFEDRIGLRQDVKEASHIFRIVGSVLNILLEGDWVRNFYRHGPDFHRNAQPSQSSHEFLVEIRHRTRRERNQLIRTLAGSNAQLVIKKIELDLKDATIKRNGGSSQSACVQVERYLPPMIDRRTLREAYFTDYLGPHVKRFTRIAPGVEW